MIPHTAPASLEAKHAWVAFSGQTDLPWLRLLKPGFRHCFVILNDGYHWITIDPLFPHTEIIVHHVSPKFDLPGWIEGRGYKVKQAPIKRDAKRSYPWMIFTCVEAVKRILGLKNMCVCTPWQLYTYLEKLSQPTDQKENHYGRISFRAESPAATASGICAAARSEAPSLAADQHK